MKKHCSDHLNHIVHASVCVGQVKTDEKRSLSRRPNFKISNPDRWKEF